MPRLDTYGRQRLVADNLRLAYYLARRVDRMGVELEDCEQAAALGLCAAAQAYDPDRHPGVPFSAYARDYVIRYLTEEVTRHVRAGLHAHLSADVAAPGPSAADDRLANEVWEAVESLSVHERTLIVRRFGLDGGAPSGLFELSVHFGVPVRSLNRLLAVARRKLGEALRAKGWTEAQAAQAASENRRIRMA